VVIGLTWMIDGRWRTYGEMGYGFATKDEIGQEPGRLQLGLVHEAPGSLGGAKRLGWFSALDLGAMEERGWQIDPSLHVGLIVPAGDRRWRIGLALHDGSVPIGEFFQDDETYIALGLWLDP
jgi:hypothetical protein